MNLPDLLSKAKELIEKATEGPWWVDHGLNYTQTKQGTQFQHVIGARGKGICNTSHYNEVRVGDELLSEQRHGRMEDAAFIAFARTALPLLVRIVERQAEALKFYSERGGPGGTGAWVLRQPYHFDMAIKDGERILLGETPYWVAGKAARTALAECEKIAAEITTGREG